MQAQVIPIATERVFVDYWRPLAHKLGLVWVPLFQSGLTVTEDDIAPIVQELTTLKQALAVDDHGVPQDISDQMGSRLHTLIMELEHLHGNPAAMGYIA